jgi:hypothetical protein
MKLTLLPVCTEFFHTVAGTAYADLVIDGHRETWPIRSRRFRAFLRRSYYRAAGTAASAAVINGAIDQLEARAQFDGPERLVHIRVAEHNGVLYLDLADSQWRVVEVTPASWQIISAPPVRFHRPPGLLPLPAPQSGGSILALQALLNLTSYDDFILVVAWLSAAMRPAGPYPLLALAGEQGSAKTVTCKILKALIDPSIAPVRTLPRDERELMIAANNIHTLAFDNVSGLPAWLSDALCRLASGGSLAVRQLYSDDAEVLFEAARPMLLNGIEDVIRRPDLADRAIVLTLPPISDAQRRPEAELWAEFELARPSILGALLDGVAHGLARRSGLRRRSLPRMADFALWAAACETALWPAGTIARAYRANRQAILESVIEADPVATCVRDLMANRDQWAGTASDFLLAADKLLRQQASIRRPDWPRTPRALAGRLRRAQTSLRAVGIDIAFHREGRSGSRMIRMRGLSSASPAPSVTSPPPMQDLDIEAPAQ